MSEHDDTPEREMSDESTDTRVMTAYAEPEDDFEDDYEVLSEDDDDLPGRPRRVLVNRYSVGLSVVLIGAACFYGGVRVEKSQVGTSSGTSALGGRAGGFSALASRFGTAGTGSASGASTTASSSSGTRSAAGATGGFSGGAGGFAGAPGGAAAGTSGTISTISGDTLYITESSGNTVKVKLSGTTALTKTVTVGKTSLYPGDTVSIQGSTGSDGTVSATSVADSGSSSSTSSTSSTGSTGTSSSSSSSGLSSLFGG